MEKAILRTLAYADVFDYPLTKEEIWRWLISSGKLKTQNLKLKTIVQNSKLIQKKNGFYSLKGRKGIVAFRKQRKQYSASKLKFAEKIAGILRLIPWVRLVGVTGALAMNNADKEDDIDLLIITARNKLWLTRLFSVFLIELTGRRRRPEDKKVKDKICLNMFLDESHLAIPEKERDLFSAHEVCQMKPIFVKEDTYSRFLQENSWVKKFLPNQTKWKMENGKWKKGKIINHQLSIINHLEQLTQALQIWYMRNRRTTEKISGGIIRFHPQDAREWVLREYQARLKRLRLV
jgi:hypothetical protein